MAKETTRGKLITNILYYSDDEFESRDDVMQLAKETDEELVDRLINLLDYYYDQVDQQRINQTP